MSKTFVLDYQHITLDGKPIKPQDVMALLCKIEAKTNDEKFKNLCTKLIDVILEDERKQ